MKVSWNQVHPCAHAQGCHESHTRNPPNGLPCYASSSGRARDAVVAAESHFPSNSTSPVLAELPTGQDRHGSSYTSMSATPVVPPTPDTCAVYGPGGRLRMSAASWLFEPSGRGQSADCNVGCSSRRRTRLSRATDLAISGLTPSPPLRCDDRTGASIKTENRVGKDDRPGWFKKKV